MKNLAINNELKVIKSLFYFSEDSLQECEWYDKEEVLDGLSELICKGDIWKVIGFDGDDVELECIEGSMKGEINDGWFDYKDVVDKNCFLLI
jgi:hypothetical protein